MNWYKWNSVETQTRYLAELQSFLMKEAMREWYEGEDADADKLKDAAMALNTAIEALQKLEE